MSKDMKDKIKEGVSEREKNVEELAAAINRQCEAEYERGTKDAWELARKIVCDESDTGVSLSDLIECFGMAYLEDIFDTHTYKQAAEKFRVFNDMRKKQTIEQITDDIVNYMRLVSDELHLKMFHNTNIDESPNLLEFLFESKIRPGEYERIYIDPSKFGNDYDSFCAIKKHLIEVFELEE